MLIISAPFGAFLTLLGLLWNTPPIDPPDYDELEELGEDLDEAEAAYHKATRRRARIAVVRLVMIAFGSLLLVGNLINTLFNLDDYGIANSGDFFTLLAIYALGLLLVQRVEANRRLFTLFVYGFVGFIVRRFALFRDLDGELLWAIYAALLLNYLFWVVIGRRFPPGSSTDIRVWGMDTTD